ncbi:MAG: 3-hydroxyacyl-CoA dehydrogenase NAD-binding domain-containing protein [Candidatus Auribacterota bacterium]|jgi:3-hydroxybutyryl-CoA dehydrogenase|uniref:3-hydroxybutyryl-CoA dehydrogenase n=1 Tax=Candidatus Auribacter fodinae TaxID=2093366 RepID=A0A3A4QUL4_9BACT|nr:MAG: 3-hydroxybutyryl-CoA dehydrogenase [Candidatus Auribacter fodinae]
MDILDIGIIGASTRGRGLAEAAALAGLNVNLVELNKETLDRGIRKIGEEMDHLIEKWGLTDSEKKAAMARIKGITSLEDLEKKCQMVIVTVREDLDLNKDIFARLDAHMSPATILVTHSAILSVTEIATATQRPDKVAGITFLPPVVRVQLGEVVRGLKTSQETYETVTMFINDRLGKTAVEVAEAPGYISIRMLVNMINEAMYLVMEGIASIEDIDTSMKLGFDMKRGPFEIADKVGLDMVLVWTKYMYKEAGYRYNAPCPLLLKLVRANNLGKKTGEGFYKYDESGKIIGVGALSQMKKWSYNV